MPESCPIVPPAIFRILIRFASWIAPRSLRPEWRARREAEFLNWWILVERGELVRPDYRQIVLDLWGASVDAFWKRFNKDSLHQFLRGPVCVIACLAGVMLLTGAASHGFRGTRALANAARIVTSPFAGSGQVMGYARAEQTLVVHGFAIVFALLAGVALVALRRVPLHHSGGRYWAFLGFKTMALVVTVPVLWVETILAARILLPLSNPGACLVILLLTIAFILAFVCALGWSFADQRRRCPICLKLLAMPVTVGSWASVLEPVTTELLCTQGHGSLLVPETHIGDPERWITLDASWRELFGASAR